MARYTGSIKLVILDIAGTVCDGPQSLSHLFPNDDGLAVKGPVIVFEKMFQKFGMNVDWETIRRPMGKFKREHLADIMAFEDVAGQYRKVHGRNYKESDPLLPKNNYSWSKLGGESSVQMYKNSLILRVCMTEKPFVHKKAFYDFNTNFIFHDEVAKILFKLINKKGIINLGGKTQTVYRFVKKFNPKIKKIYAKKILGPKYPLNPSMNIKKLKKILKKFK